MNDKINLINNDCLKVLKTISENSIDSIITDPPYALTPKSYEENSFSGGFMGHEWDKNLVSVDIWKECFRVLKSGSYAFIMCSPRQDVLGKTIFNLKEAGFNMNFSSIYWAYSTGMPKAMNLAKAVDKKLGIKRKVIGKKIVDKEIQSRSLYAGQKSKLVEIEETIATSKQAKIMDGWYAGYQPKPALEIIITCQKPLKHNSYVEQSIDYANQIINRKKTNINNGGTNLDKCRIPVENTLQKEKTSANPKGRFPSNLLISNNILDKGVVTKSIGGKSGHNEAYSGAFKESYYNNTKPGYNDSGDFSRYNNLDIWFNKKIKELPPEIQKTFPFLIVPKPSKSEKSKGCKNISKTRKCKWNNAGKWQNLETEQYGNVHPTTKPIKLMSYLITLGSRKDDVILDPFMGSGTTGIACILLERKFIGIELNKEYFEIAERRIGYEKINKEGILAFLKRRD